MAAMGRRRSLTSTAILRSKNPYAADVEASAGTWRANSPGIWTPDFYATSRLNDTLSTFAQLRLFRGNERHDIGKTGGGRFRIVFFRACRTIGEKGEAEINCRQDDQGYQRKSRCNYRNQ